MNPVSKETTYQAVKATIQTRKTMKVIGDPNSPVEITKEVASLHQPRILEAIAEAGWAPFHYDRNHEKIAEPWRFHVLWHQECRVIASRFHEWFENVKPSNKLPPMLSACGSLILVNWIPQSEPGHTNEKMVQVDEEHLAATSAAVQNLLLLLTAGGYGTYWSSGGQFRTATMFEKLNIPSQEKLLAAVFVEFPESFEQPLQRLAGKHRANRASSDQWTRIIEAVS